MARGKGKLSGNARLIAVHGNRFILHRVLRSLPLHKFDILDLDMEPIYEQAAKATRNEMEAVIETVNHHFPNEYLNTLFKIRSKCAKLDSLLPDLPTIKPTKYFGDDKPIQPPLFDE